MGGKGESIRNENFPVFTNTAVYNLDTVKNTFVRFEAGSNRMVPGGNSGKGKQAILHDGFAQMPYPSWKGAGVAIPVFSLRSKRKFWNRRIYRHQAVLVDWAKICGLKLIQLLPINDTTATHTWTDSYPYAAISAFALHPMYLNLEKVAGTKNAPLVLKN